MLNDFDEMCKQDRRGEDFMLKVRENLITSSSSFVLPCRLSTRRTVFNSKINYDFFGYLFVFVVNPFMI